MDESTELADPVDLTQDRRNSFRCALPQTDEAGLLRTRRSDLMVRVVEKSAGGFALEAQAKPPLQIGQCLSLALSTGCYEVRVAHVTELDGESRIGLALVRELSFMPPTGELFSMARHGILSFVGKGMQLVFLVALCTMVFTIGIAIATGSWRDKLGFAHSKVTSASPISSWAPPDREHKLAKTFTNLDGLKARKFFNALKLSTEQQVKVHAVVEETSVALADLYKHKDLGPSDVWSDLGLQLIHRSYEKIQRELTDEQKARWAELSK